MHLWCYDKFNCVRWGSGRQPGAFKRVMTYSYLTTLPLLVCFSVAITVFKFREGFMELPSGHSIPRPVHLWRPNHRKWVVPLYFLFSTGWSLEIVTHLEELTFWLFLLNQGRVPREWFRSFEYTIWCLGSCFSVLGMPLLTLITKRNVESCSAWIMLVGSSASTLTTILFLYVLVRFPGFIRYVKRGGAAAEVIVRLLTFYQLNLIRVIFRFFFSIPFLILGIDGVHGRHAIILHPFGSDFLIMMGGIGCVVSSAMTLFIFFPRSIANESGYSSQDLSIHDHKKNMAAPFSPRSTADRSSIGSHLTNGESSPTVAAQNISMDTFSGPDEISELTPQDTPQNHRPATEHHHDPPFHNRHRHPGMPMPSYGRNLPVNLHPYVMNFTSPIDLPDPSELTRTI